MKIKSGLILALAAGSVATAADDITPIKLDYQTREAGYDGYIYHVGTTGERIVSTEASATATGAARGAGWTWTNNVIDHCVPDAFPDDGVLNVGVFTGMHSEAAGDAIDPFAVRYWGDWFEAPGDTIINGISFTTFAQIVDVDGDGNGVGDGVAGLDWFLVFTEEDRLTDRSGATAHSPILVESIAGSLDVGATDGVAGDGLISFQEGQLIINFIDLTAGATPTDIEIADTNGMSDGAFGVDSIFSGIPGVDMSPTDGTDDAGIGFFNLGFVIGFRQPNVAEGDGIIDRYPELAGVGLENADGLDPNTFPNILPVGVSLTGPSEREEANPGVEGGITLWPLDGVAALPGEGLGQWDGMTLIDALGVDQGGAGGAFYFGGAACDPVAQAALTAPFYVNPWAGYDLAFNVNLVGEPVDPGCNDADNAEPFGVLDLADIGGFVTAFQGGCGEAADIAEPFGVCDLADIGAFVTAFQAGCP